MRAWRALLPSRALTCWAFTGLALACGEPPGARAEPAVGDAKPASANGPPDSTVPAAPPIEAQAQVRFSAVRVPSPEGTFGIAGVFEISDGWHIYWHNPGDAGLATTLEVERGAAVEFPYPERFVSPGDIESFGYGHEVALFTLTHPPAPGSPVEVEASWLACRESCIKQSAKTTLSFDAPVSTDHAAQRLRVPTTALPRAFRPRWEGDTLHITSPEEGSAIVDFFPAAVDPMLFAHASFKALGPGGAARGASLTWTRGGSQSPHGAQGVALVEDGDPNTPLRAYTVRVPWSAP